MKENGGNGSTRKEKDRVQCEGWYEREGTVRQGIVRPCYMEEYIVEHRPHIKVGLKWKRRWGIKVCKRILRISYIPTHPLVEKTCLKWREALMKVARHSLRTAMSSQCRIRAPLMTLRNRRRSLDHVVVLDMPRNNSDINWWQTQDTRNFNFRRFAYSETL